PWILRPSITLPTPSTRPGKNRRSWKPRGRKNRIGFNWLPRLQSLTCRTGCRARATGILGIHRPSHWVSRNSKGYGEAFRLKITGDGHRTLPMEVLQETVSRQQPRLKIKTVTHRHRRSHLPIRWHLNTKTFGVRSLTQPNRSRKH